MTAQALDEVRRDRQVYVPVAGAGETSLVMIQRLALLSWRLGSSLSTSVITVIISHVDHRLVSFIW